MPLDLVSQILSGAVRMGTPLLLAALGEIYAERSGVVNLGVEGMMLVGALAGFAVAYQTGSCPLALLAACLAGLTLSVIHGLLTVYLNVNHIASGLALTILGAGLSAFLGRAFTGRSIPALPSLPIPLLSGMPYVGEAFFNQNPVVYLGYVLVAIMWFLLFKTSLGLSIRAVGEDPSVADSAGIPVYRVRFLCVLMGGALCGLAGSTITLALTPSWQEGVTAGRGWIALALVIVSLWDPLKLIAVSYLFGGLESIQFRVQHLLPGVSAQLLATIPYVATIAVLVAVSTETLKRRIGAPASLAKPYRRESA